MPVSGVTFDGNGTPLSEFGGSTQSTAMTYDALGDVTSVNASLPAAPSSYSGTTNYQYDAKTELTQEASTRSGGYTNANSYDLAENPTQVRGVAQPTANADNQIPVSGVTFDGSGNPTTYGGTTLAFDGENRLSKYGTSTMSATYDATNLRASKTNSAGTTYYLYDGILPVCELSATGSVNATNTFGGGGLLSRHSGSSSTFYTFDAQGNVSERLSSTGTVQTASTFDAFGLSTSTGTVSDPFGYCAKWGYYTDTETGLQLATFRYYDPSAGGFLTRDPISYAGGVNLYNYTHNNAVNLQDPIGQSPTSDEKACERNCWIAFGIESAVIFLVCAVAGTLFCDGNPFCILIIATLCVAVAEYFALKTLECCLYNCRGLPCPS